MFAAAAVFLVVRERKKQILFYFAVILCYYGINKGLILATDAESGSIFEALSVPLQQIARLYNEEGEAAFTSEELDFLYSCIEPSMILNYDPFRADRIKYAFWRHSDVIMENRGKFLALWAGKGLRYPGIYAASVLDNTYQAWYPGTVLRDTEGDRYFDVTGWQEEYGKPLIQWVYDYYRNVRESYWKYPVLRLFCSTGAMFWVCLLAWGYGLWRKDGRVALTLGLLLLVCLTSFCGPVSDLRYYLILFYMAPVCVGFLMDGRGADDRCLTGTKNELQEV